MDSNFIVQNKPLAIIQVNLKDHQEKILIYKNDNVEEVAQRFCDNYDIDESFKPHIIKLIQSEILKNTKQLEPENKSSTSKMEQSKPKITKTNDQQIQDVQIQNKIETESQNEELEQKQKNIAENYENWQKLIRQKQNENEKHRKLVLQSNSSKSGPLPQNLNPLKQATKIQKGFQKPQTTFERNSSSISISKIEKGQNSEIQSNKKNDQYSFKQFRQSLKKSNNPSPKLQSKTPPSRISKSYNRKQSSKVKSRPPQKIEKSSSQQSDKVLTQFLNRQEASKIKNQQIINELRHQKNLLVDTQTGQRYFTPKIRKDSYYEKVSQRVNAEDQELTSELLMSFKINKKLEEESFTQNLQNDITQNNVQSQVQDNQYQITAIKSENYDQKQKSYLSQSQLKEIFLKLDKNQDGQISAQNLSLDQISNNQLEAIQELLFDLDENQLQYSFEGFLNAYELRIREPNNLNSYTKQNLEIQQEQFSNVHSKELYSQKNQFLNENDGIFDNKALKKTKLISNIQPTNKTKQKQNEKINQITQNLKEISEEQQPQLSKEIPKRYQKLLSQFN